MLPGRRNRMLLKQLGLLLHGGLQFQMRRLLLHVRLLQVGRLLLLLLYGQELRQFLILLLRLLLLTRVNSSPTH